MFGLVFSKRVEDEHWWDADPQVRKRNREWEDRLESVVPARHHAPRQDSDDEMSHVWPAVLKFGIIPGAFLYMLYLTTGEMRKDIQEIKITQQAAVHEQRQVAIELRAATTRGENSQGIVIDLLRAQCVNSAKTQQERGDCLRAGR